MGRTASKLLGHPAAWCAVGLAYFGAAVLSLYLTEGVHGMATIWPASGIFVAALLLFGKGRLVWICGSVAVASFAANYMFGANAADAAAFTAANLVEGLVVSQLVLRTSGAPGTLEDPHWVATFFGAAMVGAVSGSIIATAFAGGMNTEFFISWFATVSLGLLIVTPIVVTIARGLSALPIKLSKRQYWQAVTIFPLVTILSIAVFQQDTYPLLFLPLIGVLAATYAFGPNGAAISILIIAVAGTVGDVTGGGPSRFVAEGMVGETRFFQFYLLSLLLAAWPLSALLAEKRKLIEDYAESNSLLELAESTANLGHWYFSFGGAGLIWSNEVYRIHGVDPETFEMGSMETLDRKRSLSLYHPDDREHVRDTLSIALQRQAGFTYNARVVRPDGTIRNISSIGEPTFNRNGEFTGLFGTFQDTTKQTEMLEALRLAQEAAEREAAKSKRLAETDELTGIANRRKALRTLEQEVAAAHKSGKALTLAIFDIDFFKTVNDRFGHNTGDRVLKRVTVIANRCLRDGDLIGRLGGEEFMVILPGENGRNAEQIAERLRLAIAEEHWSISGLDQVTVSIGLAALTPGQSAQELLGKADEALYRAKDDGRNLLRSAA
ncbi:sensor domain-containing diguanylate cyclase [Altererythrobacter sp. ZODW24]|uniref:sensor domain-containing diguanylate cyclase n=1 Tax=Altererythrobacter sp. ZODW24 TaxID=2185142 RepID=UPI000DF7EFAC|nr:sensor domain-containing diguanylate cyclase [Altererythrobacter sp. ZODW24]